VTEAEDLWFCQPSYLSCILIGIYKKREKLLSTPHFLVHDGGDAVGVIVVEGVKSGQMLTGWVMNGDKTIKLKSTNAIPLGHKIALKDIVKDTTILKYGHDIGKAISKISKGGHVHVHNVKTKRW